MGTLLIALASFFGFIIAYNTYGRFLARRIFDLNPDAEVPASQLNDGVDFVPTKKSIVFGHHFTSIAGTGPIVGPAIAVFWGWLPALLWVVFGSIFIGAVHDFGALVVSMRSRGQTIGDVAGRMISRRARLLFLFILFLALMIVLAIFGLVIAVIFSIYPESVLSVWLSMPIAIFLGYWFRNTNHGLLVPSLVSLVLLYLAVVVGVRWAPVTLGDLPLFGGTDASYIQAVQSSVVVWTFILLAYCFAASVLPVWLLLQPRDYINSHQLLVALGLLMLGLFIAQPEMAAPAINDHAPGDAPPIFPFLFITIACGAISGFHCLVSSGTSSKQLERETDAQYVGFGAMLLEGALAVLVIIACTAGIGMGVTRDGVLHTGADAWHAVYGSEWASMKMEQQVRAFVDGGANMVAACGIPSDIAVGIIAVMVACFAATTLDTAARLQRYVIQEIGGAVRIRLLEDKYIATGVAVCTGAAMAMISGPFGPGSGGLILWPLFGAVNQLLAGLAFMVIAFYLIRHNKPVWFLAAPLCLMVVLPAWAMCANIVGYYAAEKWHLVGVGVFIEVLQVWMILEGLIMWRKARGVLPEPLPPLQPAVAHAGEGGRAR